MDSKPAFAISLLITLLIVSNFYFFHTISKPQRGRETIKRIIDGDTLVLQTDEIVRLENINTPEKGEYGYEQAKSFLQQFENQTIEIERTGIDKYQRTLAKIYTPNYLNLEIVQKGFAKKYLVDDSEKRIFEETEKQAIESESGLWKKSDFFGCIQSKIFQKEEMLILSNSCQENIQNFTIRDESRKNFNIIIPLNSRIYIYSGEGESNETTIFLRAEDIWDNDKDTLYLFSSDNSLLHYHSYGY